MKYKNEKIWSPKEHYSSNRNEKREFKKFGDKIQKKTSPFIKWIFNKYLSNSQKETLFYSYRRDVNYYNIINNGENSIIMSKIIHSIIVAKILPEKDYKTIKRKWVISKILD